MAVALAAASGERHELIEDPLMQVPEKKPARRVERNTERSAGKRLRMRRGRNR